MTTPKQYALHLGIAGPTTTVPSAMTGVQMLCRGDVSLVHACFNCQGMGLTMAARPQDACAIRCVSGICARR